MIRVAVAVTSFCLLVCCNGTPVTEGQAQGRKTPGDATTQTLEAPASPATPAVVTEDGSRFLVEVVAEPVTRAQGLMYRSSLSPDRGMLFIFPEKAEHAFWMKNTLIPLDIIWIDEHFEIVHVAHDVQPCRADPCPSYPPGAHAVFVLELGRVRRGNTTYKRVTSSSSRAESRISFRIDAVVTADYESAFT